MTRIEASVPLTGRAGRQHMRRLLDPASVAVVGARQGETRSDNVVNSLLETEVEVYLVNPTRDAGYGKPTFPSLASIGHPIDAVLSLVNAPRSIEVIESAAKLGVGGVVVIAAGFGEAGSHGLAMEEKLRAAVGEMALIGPNCNGFVNARRGIRLCGSPPIPVLPGRVGLVTHSGGFIAFAMLAARERRIGFSWLISPGNEAALDLVDYMDFLIDDADTRVICLVIERVERPRDFLASAERARRAGKPVIAMRLATGERARTISRSHTGAIISGGGDLSAALESAGAISSSSLEEMLDGASGFEQINPERWGRVRGVGVLTASGGIASSVSDLFDEHALPLPDLNDLKGKIEVSPEPTVMNPIDLTGSVIGQPELFGSVLSHYLLHPDIDNLVLVRGLDEYFRSFGGLIFDRYIEAAQATDRRVWLASVVDARIDAWVDDIPEGTVAHIRGLRGLVTALKAMDHFIQGRDAIAEARPRQNTTIPSPSAAALNSEVGAMLPFGETMKLLQAIGVPTAPYKLLSEAEPASADALSFPEPFVVKVANAPHRTEIGAIRTGVKGAEIASAVQEMRELARTHGLQSDVVVQPQMFGQSEAFIGLDTESAFGPIIVCGVGGVRLEMTQGRAARLAPLSSGVAEMMLEQINAETHVLNPHRGQELWNRNLMVQLLMAVSDVAVSARWLGSLDINPLIINAGTAVAVDALCVLARR